MNPIKSSPELFDGQAMVFDQRAGLSADHCRGIASAVLEAGQVLAGDLVVEIGAGTGQIGHWFGAPVRYLGIDLSDRMLQEFRRRAGGLIGQRALIRADANTRWPLTNGIARVIFSSRTMHLLDHEHVADEAFRVARSDGATVIIGRVERDPQSVKARLAAEMLARMRRCGFEGRGGGQHRKLVGSFCRRGAEILEPEAVISWRVVASPRQSLQAWWQLPGLGGILIPALARKEILSGLEVWAEKTFGGLDQEYEIEETYVLKALRVLPHAVKRE
jgi:ubiquinone/menaquinone biosynthesis C-methylase UbiE